MESINYENGVVEFMEYNNTETLFLYDNENDKPKYKLMFLGKNIEDFSENNGRLLASIPKSPKMGMII